MQAVIHLIDDDEALRESVAFLLRAADFEVKGFSSAQAFLASLPDASLSCVITDMRMPDMSGIELIRRLKDLKVDIPVIVITGLIEGRANKRIAFDLGISPRTVEIYRANLMTKMQADSLSDLVRMALIVEMLGSS